MLDLDVFLASKLVEILNGKKSYLGNSITFIILYYILYIYYILIIIIKSYIVKGIVYRCKVSVWSFWQG